MESYNAIGFTNFWGFTPAYNVLKNDDFEDNQIVNILLSDSNDFRHFIKTCFKSFEKKEQLNINFYVHESNMENICRLILFIHIINDTNLNIRDRVEYIMETYGNTFLSERTANYINSNYKKFIEFVSGDKKYKGILKEIIDLSCLTFQQKDELNEIFESWDLRTQYDIDKYRDDRLRYYYKDRYDYRENIVDWDYQMHLKNFAPIISLKQYTKFRLTGISFETRINKYNVANRTLSSYIYGKKVCFNKNRKIPMIHVLLEVFGEI